MSKNQEFIEDLVVKFQNNKITPAELEELLNWYNDHDDERVMVNLPEHLNNDQVKEKIREGLLFKIQEDERIIHRSEYRLKPWIWIASAAAVLIVSLVSIRYWNISSDAVDATVEVQQDTIKPGGNKAVLILADGRQVPLDTRQEGIVMTEGIQYVDGDQLAERIDIESSKQLELYVPQGGIYQITLSDGTQVWLNSDSRLKYPSHFANTNRMVELEGEAYFAVNTRYDTKGQRIPFVVKTKGQSVEVLGTTFNVNAYNTQAFTKTTLIEGKVNIQTETTDRLLFPGQQAQVSGNRLWVKQVDTKQAVAWKEGKFSFDGESFEETMANIGRWYNLKIVYKNAIPDVELVGDAFRNENIKLVLRILDASAIRYKMDIPSRTLVIY